MQGLLQAVRCVVEGVERAVVVVTREEGEVVKECGLRAGLDRGGQNGMG